jgi:RNAse (barnase) inhibitor barstar
MDLKHLLDDKGPWFHLRASDKADGYDAIVGANGPDAIFAAAGKHHAKMILRRVRGWKAKTTAALFDELAAAFQFPSYFGENWNALNDCLTDLAWLPGDVYVLLIERAGDLLASESPQEFQTCSEVLANVSKEWSSKRKGFHTVLECKKSEEPALAHRLKAAKVTFEA